jgi:DNA mismatch endonuclease, patch repair protein
MADVVTKEKRSEVMSKIRSTNTKPELLVRKFLFSQGFRFRLHDKKLPSRPDIKLSKYSCLIFVNGCFWHGHKNCRNYVMPKTNKKFWYGKIENNVKRDHKNLNELKKMGWKIIIIWECQLRIKKRGKTLNNLHNKILGA